MAAKSIFAITVRADGQVRLDAITVNEILDVSISRVAARVMGMFESAVGVADDIEMVAADPGQVGPSRLPDAAVVGADGELAFDDPQWDARVVANRFHHSTSTMSGLARVLGFDGQSFPGASPIRTAEAALSVSWVNKDLANPDANFNSGWRHDGVAPDSRGVAVKYFSGAKTQVGPDEFDAGADVWNGRCRSWLSLHQSGSKPLWACSRRMVRVMKQAVAVRALAQSRRCFANNLL